MKKVILSIVLLIALTTSSFAQDPYIGEIRIFSYAPGRVMDDWVPCDGRVLQVSQYQALYSLIGNQYGGTAPTTFAVPDLRGKVVVGYNAANQQQYGVGKTGGAETVILAANQIPVIPHTHAATVTDAAYSAALTDAVYGATLTDAVYGATATGTVSPKAKTGMGSYGTSPQSSYMGPSSTPLYSSTASTTMAPSDLAITVNVTKTTPGTVAITKTTAGAVTINKTTPGTVTIQPNTGTNAIAHENRMPYVAIQYFICTLGLYPSFQ